MLENRERLLHGMTLSHLKKKRKRKTAQHFHSTAKTNAVIELSTVILFRNITRSWFYH